MNDLRKAAEDLLEGVEAAIKAGDWKVDGAIDPESAIVRLRQALDDKPPVKTYCGGKPNYCTPEETPDVDAVNMSQEPVDKTAKGEHEPFIYIRADTEMPFGGYEHCGKHEPGAFPVYLAPPRSDYHEGWDRLIRIMGTFDLATGHADNWDELLDSLESELRDVLGHLRARHEYVLDCPRCGHYCSERKWVGLTDEEVDEIYMHEGQEDVVLLAQAKLKEKNNG